MTWRDEPDVIWQDDDVDRLRMVEVRYPGHWRLVTDEDGLALPTEPAEQDEMLHRLAAVLGRRIVGIEAAPRPIEVGDVVVTVDGDSPFGPLAVLGGPWDSERGPGVAVRDGSGTLWLVRTSRLSLVEDVPEPEPEPEIIEQGDLTEEHWAHLLSVALDAGDRVESLTANAGWMPTRASGDEFRGTVMGGVTYRIVRGGNR